MDEDMIYLNVGPKANLSTQKTKFQVKRSLIMAGCSSIRNSLLDDQNCNEVCVVYDNTDIFQKAIDFINGTNLDGIRDLDTLIQLEDAAHSLGMDNLGIACEQAMIASINCQTVWKIYDSAYSERVVEECQWLLSTRTQELLDHPKFLEIKPKTLAGFLRLNEMNIESETVLLEACRRFVGLEFYGPAREVFREYALPYIRVLNLLAPDIYHIESFFTTEEFKFLEFRMRYPKKHAPEVHGLCLDKRDRRPAYARTLLIEPDVDIYEDIEQKWYGPTVLSPTQKDTFILTYKMKKRVQMQRIVFFWPKRTCSLEDQLNELKISHPPIHMGANCKLKISKRRIDYAEIIFLVPIFDMMRKRTASIKLDNVEVPKSARVTIEIEINGAEAFHKFFKSESSIFQSSDPSIKKVVRKVKLMHLHDGKERKDEWNTTVFKSIHMILT